MEAERNGSGRLCMMWRESKGSPERNEDMIRLILYGMLLTRMGPAEEAGPLVACAGTPHGHTHKIEEKFVNGHLI